MVSLEAVNETKRKKNLMAVNIYKTGVFLLSFWAYISYIFICISNFYPLSFARKCIEQILVDNITAWSANLKVVAKPWKRTDFETILYMLVNQYTKYIKVMVRRNSAMINVESREFEIWIVVATITCDPSESCSKSKFFWAQWPWHRSTTMHDFFSISNRYQDFFHVTV